MPGLLGRVAQQDAVRRARGCSRPIRLVGSTVTQSVDGVTGELGSEVDRYGSANELDGYTYVRCGDRRAHRCESCSREYKGDAWHLLVSGLTGGKGVPETVASHPSTFATFTAPTFGPVHGLRQRGPCRARRDRPVCPHGRPLFCLHRHQPGDTRLGQPLCLDCYDYPAHVLWQWHAPELWRRFRIRLDRTLAHRVGVHDRDLRDLARVAYTKVGEFQARGVIHFHAVFRLDGPEGPDTPPAIALDADDLGDAITTAAGDTRLEVPVPGTSDVLVLRWGEQLDVRPIQHGAGRDAATGDVHPEMVAGYAAKYLVKSTEEFGLTQQVYGPDDARRLGVNPHVVRIIEAARDLIRASAEDRASTETDDDFERLADRYTTLGYRGHVLTKTRRYSVTFGSLRQARRSWRAERQPRLDPDATVREIPRDADPDDTTAVVVHRTWAYAGSGYLDLDAAERALQSATRSREHRAGRAGESRP
jgi:hypothetical protein